MTDKQLMELRERNEARVKEAIERLGPRWLLHSANRVSTTNVNNPIPRSLLHTPPPKGTP